MVKIDETPEYGPQQCPSGEQIVVTETLHQTVELENGPSASPPRSPSPAGSDLWRNTNNDLLDKASDMLNSYSPLQVLKLLFPGMPTPPASYGDRAILSILSELIDQPPIRKKLPDFNTFSDAVELFRRSKKILMLTGAGVSVSCGIPDFRSKDGIYARLHVDFPDLPDPTAMFDISYFRRNPAPFFDFAKEIFPGQFEPSVSHKFIKCLEENEQLLRNYTQNIDTLERQTGITRVVECHGSFSKATCLTCGMKYPGEAIKEDVMAKRVARCTKCKRGIIKPDIVFFGEDLGHDFHQQMALDKDHVDLVVVIGSSLKVRPVSLIPFAVSPDVPQILINREPLSNYTADIELLGNCDDIITNICLELGGPFQKLVDEHDARISEKNGDNAEKPTNRKKLNEIAVEKFYQIMQDIEEREMQQASSSSTDGQEDEDSASSPKKPRLDLPVARRHIPIDAQLPKDSYFRTSTNRCVFPGSELHYDLVQKRCVVINHHVNYTNRNGWSSDDDDSDDSSDRSIRGGSEPAVQTCENEDREVRSLSCAPALDIDAKMSAEKQREELSAAFCQSDDSSDDGDAEMLNDQLIDLF